MKIIIVDDEPQLHVNFSQANGMYLMRKLNKLSPDQVLYFTMQEYSKLFELQSNKRICARTFGRFDLFVNGALVKFRNSKAKELLALCIDHRGGEVTMEEAIDKLWENRPYDCHVKQNYRTTVMQLRFILKEHNIEELFKNTRGKCHINASLIDCDYYNLLDAQRDALLKFDYTYMEEYSWAEDTLGTLCEYVNRLRERDN